MKQELNDLFSPIELIEALDMNDEIQPSISKGKFCDVGYVCFTGIVEI